MFQALVGRFLTTVPPGKSLISVLLMKKLRIREVMQVAQGHGAHRLKHKCRNTLRRSRVCTYHSVDCLSYFWSSKFCPRWVETILK